MAKIDLANEVLRHTDEEIIEYLYGLASALYRQYNNVENPTMLLSARGDVEQIHTVLRALNRRNKEKSL